MDSFLDTKPISAEEQTKAYMLAQKQSIVAEILKAKTAIVVAHVNPDGDTLASMLALAKVLEQCGLDRVDRVMHDKVPEVYKFFPDGDLVVSSSEANHSERVLSAYDMSFSCDCGSVLRLGSAGALWNRAGITCNIDHHLSNPLFAKYNFVDVEATSTGQVIKDLALALKSAGQNIVIDKDLASLLYITLLTDTGGFRHSNTNKEVFIWASELVRQGADPSYLYNQLFNQIPARAIQVIGDALAGLEFLDIKDLYVAYTKTSRATLEKFNADDEDTEEIVDHIMRIKNLDICLYLRESKKPGMYKGSLRSACDIDCSKIAEQINGGGHARAAGFNCEAGSFDELKQRVFDLIQATAQR
jgi:phosphoesterase RecJ-like protein